MKLNEKEISVDDLVNNFNSSKFDTVLNLSNLLLKTQIVISYIIFLELHTVVYKILKSLLHTIKKL